MNKCLLFTVFLAVAIMIPAIAGTTDTPVVLNVETGFFETGVPVDLFITNGGSATSPVYEHRAIINVRTGETVVAVSGWSITPAGKLGPGDTSLWRWDQRYDVWLYNADTGQWEPSLKNGLQVPPGLYEAYYRGSTVRFQIGDLASPGIQDKGLADAIKIHGKGVFDWHNPKSALTFSTSAVSHKEGHHGGHKGPHLKVFADKKNYEIGETVNISKVNKWRDDILTGPGYLVTTPQGEIVWAGFWIEVAILLPPGGSLDYTWDQTYQGSSLGVDGTQVENGHYVIRDNKGPGKTHIWIDF